MSKKSKPKDVWGKNAFAEIKSRLPYMIPWQRIDENGIIYNKDDSLQMTFSYRPLDIESATEQELVINTARLNNILRRLGTGWVVNMEAQRRKSEDYMTAKMSHPLTQIMEDERREYFQSGDHFENTYYFTILYAPPTTKLERKFFSWFFKDSAPVKELEVEIDEKVRDFLHQAEIVFGLLDELLPDCRVLTPDETLTYLHSTVSDRYHKVRVPYPAMMLDSYLYDSDFAGELQPKLGDSHCRIVTILYYAPQANAGFLDPLNNLGFEYRWVSRFIFLDKSDANTEMENYKAAWNQQTKGITQRLQEIITRKESPEVNETALIKKDEISLAIQDLNMDYVGYGYYSMSVIVLDQDEDEVKKKAMEILKAINNLGFTAKIEDLNSGEAWFGSLPGVYRANVRRNMVSTLNFCHMAPASDIWAGEKMNEHLKGPTLLYADTIGSVPFRLSLHQDDVGHAMIVGPTGAGKSVLLNTLEAHFQKYPGSRMFIFDKAASSRALTLALGGNFYNLGVEGNGELSFQPLAQIDNENERSWAAEWLYNFLRLENFSITPREKELIWDALNTLADMPDSQRTLSIFVGLVQDQELRQAFGPLTKGGSYGKLFDSNVDRFGSGRWQVFEMETLMNTPAIVPATLDYLFHRIEAQLKEDGAPSMIVLDECWLYLKNPIFAEKLREYFKDMRKKNTGIIFATQNLSDIADSEIANTVMGNCPTQIFLPNIKATNEHNMALYRSFGLNDRQIHILSQAMPRRQYYLTTPKGNRLFELSLQPVEKAFVTATSKEDQIMIDQLLREYPREEFTWRWLEYKHLPEEAAKIRRQKNEQKEQSA